MPGHGQTRRDGTDMTYREEMLENDPVRIEGGKSADIRFHDGGLPHVKGVKNYQILRACRDPEYAMDGCGWTYNHAPMIAWWQGRFFVEYLSNVKTEHEPPSQTLLSVSEDGRHWSDPVGVFPTIRVDTAPYTGPGKELLGDTVIPNCHQRMGFYVTSTDRLLVSAFYGISPHIHLNPNNGYGIGRVVREIYPDLTYSPVYFLRYNEPGGYKRDNIKVFPYFEEAEDAGFVEGCREFLNDRLVVQQWWEEQRFDKELFTAPGGAALSYYTLPDGDVIGIYKTGAVIRSSDRGETWSAKVNAWSLETNTAKVWGEKTQDGRYALIYNPSRNGAHRWPLVIVTGEDGIRFSGLAALVPEISPCRYEGGLKNFGAQYMRGIAECNPRPEEQKLRMTYSINKEDIWALEVPLPVTSTETADVMDDFAAMEPHAELRDWNLYIPKWCNADVEELPEGRGLVLRDGDPYDRVRAERLVAAGDRTRIVFRMNPARIRSGAAAVIQAEDAHGREAVRMAFRSDGWIWVKGGGSARRWKEYPNGWMRVEMLLDCVKGSARITVSPDSTETVTKDFSFNQPLESAARVVFTTKETLPWQTIEDDGVGGMIRDLPDDRRRNESYWILGSFEGTSSCEADFD